MIAPRHIVSSLPLLAAALADTNGIRVVFGGERASVRGRTITIPALPVDSDAEAIATVRGHIDLQSAHLLHTNRRAVHRAGMDGIATWCWRIIEDWRVGTKMASVYPGCRQNLDWLVRRECAFWAGAQADDDPAMAVLRCVRAIVLGWNVPEVLASAADDRERVRAMFPGLLERLEAMLGQVRAHCPDTQDAIDHAIALATCLRNWGLDMTDGADVSDGLDGEANDGQGSMDTGDTRGDNAPENPAGQEDADTPGAGGNVAAGEEDMDDSAGAGACEEAAGSAGGESGAPADAFGQDVSGGHTGSDNATTQTTQGGGAGAGHACLDELFQQPWQRLPRTLGDALADRLEDMAQSPDSEEYWSSYITPREGTRRVQAFSAERCRQCLRATVALRTRLQALLQADTLRYCSLGRRGKLHPKSLYRLAVGNPRIFLRESEARAVDTAVHILLDASGSMWGNRMELASEACFAVGRALEVIRGVSVGVTVFPAEDGDVFSLVRHGERVPVKMALQGGGGTPMAEALFQALRHLVVRKEARKMVLVLSDGEPNVPEMTLTAVKTLATAGIECFGIGIMTESMATLLPHSHRIIQRIEDLAPAMFAMLQDTLRNGLKAG